MRMDYVYKQLHRIISTVRFDGRLVLGMGNWTNLGRIENYFKAYSVGLKGVLDNNPKLSGTSYGELMVFRPEELLVPFNDKALIFIYSPGYWREMRKQLISLGYKEGKHFFVIHEQKKDAGQMKRFVEAVKLANLGKGIYKKIMKQYGTDVEIILMRGATGDVFLNGLYLQPYLQKKQVKKYVVAGDAKALSRIAKLFDIDNICTLNYWEAEGLQEYYKFSSPRNMKDAFLWQLSLHLNRCQTRMHRSFNFLDTYSYYIYEGLVDPREWKKPRFTPLDETLEEKYKSMGMKKGKTVILAPYAYSVRSLPNWFWRKIIENLKQRGYEVYINLNPKEEVNVFPGTVSAFFSFDELEAALCYAGHFLALRSGLCDITSMIPCRQVILYPDEMQDIDYTVHRSDIDFSSFNAMGFDTTYITEISSPAIQDIVIKGDKMALDEMVLELNELIKKVTEQF